MMSNTAGAGLYAPTQRRSLIAPGSALKFLTILILLLTSELTPAQPVSSEVSGQRPTIGLVLSGGGARGASHIGVLKVLEELRIPIDIITGTSMGAIVGGLYASGYSIEEIEKLLEDTDWNTMFSDEQPRKKRSYRRKQDDFNFLIKQEAGFKDGRVILPKGLLQGQQLRLRLTSLNLFAARDFDAMPIRFRAVAADIESGEAVILGSGSLTTAMLASMAIPGVFAPVEWNGRLLVDGGFANNVPVQLARDMGADIVIVVDLSSELKGREGLSSPFSILNQILGFTLQSNTAVQLGTLGPDDILIQPELGGYSSTDFWRASEMVDIGVTAARLSEKELKNLTESEGMYANHLSAIRQGSQTQPIIDNIEFDNQSPLSADVLRSHIPIEPGDRFDISALERGIQDLYGLNIFERVDYDLLEDEEQTALLIEAKEKEWGPNYLRFGLSMETDFEGSGTYNFATGYTMTPINRQGGEWRTELQIGNDRGVVTELYQPLDDRLRYYVKTSLGHRETHVGQFESGQKVADWKVSSSYFSLAAGRQLGNWGQLEIGAYTGSGDASPYIGDPSIPTQDSNSGAWEFRFTLDQLDSINIPRSGLLGNLSWTASREELGADNEYDAWHANGVWAGTWGKHTFVLWGGMAGVSNSDVPAESAYSIGGLFNLSGYHKSELSGRYAGMMRLVYLKEFSESRSVMKVPLYFGMSLEAGNVWNQRDDIRFDSLISAGTIGLVIDSPIGPIYLTRGFAEGGRTATYLLIGRTFTFF